MNILYTYNLMGNTAHLPRLHTHIRQLSATLDSKPVLLDLGASCHSSVWHCQATEGRSMLIILDAMGYDVVHVEKMPPHIRAKLQEQVRMALVDDYHPHTANQHYYATTPRLVDVIGQKICLLPTDNTHIREGWLYLQAIMGDEVGIVQIAENHLVHRIEKIPPNTPPDTTTSGIVDFVLGEARYYQTKR